MTAGIQHKTTDLDSIYESILGSPGASVGFQVSGTDIANRYTALANTSIANGNIASRIPPTGNITSSGTDLSSLFAGDAGNYAVTTLSTATSSTGTRTVGATLTLTHQFTVTFSSAAALTSYFTYGGRIMLTAANSGSFAANTADLKLQQMFASMGTFVIYDVACYRTGAGGTINNAVGGTNVSSTSTPGTLLYTLTDGTPYSTSNYKISMWANAAAGSATVLTITAIITLVQAGSTSDSYAGSRISTVTQRNYAGVVTPTPDAAPTFSQTTFNW